MSKLLKWIIRTWWAMLAWFVLRDGHTTHHYKASDKNIIKDQFGNVTVWKDSSGNGHDAKCYDGYADVIETVVRDCCDGKLKRTIIYMSLKTKNNIKYLSHE